MRYVLPVLLVAAALSLARALATHDGVGGPEYVVGGAAVALLVTVAWARLRHS